ARYYDPATGRFLSQDPAGLDAGDLNLYRYVNNAPTNGTDPSGMTWDDLVNLFRYPSDALAGAYEGGKNLVKGAGGLVADTALTAVDVAAYGGQAMAKAMGNNIDYQPRSSLFQGAKQAPDKARFALEPTRDTGLNA